MVVGSTICIVSESPIGNGSVHLEQVPAKSGFAVLQCGQIIMYAVTIAGAL